VSCAWPADLTVDGTLAAPHECCCHDPTAPTSPCKLFCSPPSPSLPPSAPPNDEPEALPPPPSQPPSRVGDYSRMVITDEAVLDVGGLVYLGTQSTPWGEPRHITLQPAVRPLASLTPSPALASTLTLTLTATLNPP
jgi:hypothetical protein